MLVRLRVRGVPTNHRVLSEMPDIAQFGKGRLLKLGLHIEAVLFRLVLCSQELLQIHRLKAGKGQVEVLRFQFTEQCRQQVVIPRAGDLVERDVEGFFPGLIHIHHGTGHFGVAKLHRNTQSLVSPDNCHIGIDHQRIRKPKLQDGILDLLVLLIPRLQLLPGVIGSRLEYTDRQHF